MRSKEIIRLAAAAVMRTGLQLSSRPYVALPGTMLVIAPHADDETLGCGGLIAAQARAGRGIEVVFLTDSAGSPPGSAQLAATRRGEALAALAILGVGPEHAHFLGLPDGTLDRLAPAILRAAREQLTQRILALRPGEVLAPYRHGGSTEHTAAWELVAAALAAAGGGRLVEYPIWAWWNPLRLRRRLGRRDGNLVFPLGAGRATKARALACHRSQLWPVPPATEPALPAALVRACGGSREFFFASHISAGQATTA